MALSEGIGLAGASQPDVVMSGFVAEALHQDGRSNEAMIIARQAIDELQLRVTGDSSMHFYLNRLQNVMASIAAQL